MTDRNTQYSMIVTSLLGWHVELSMNVSGRDGRAVRGFRSSLLSLGAPYRYPAASAAKAFVNHL